MPDYHFFKKPEPLQLSELVDLTGAELKGADSGSVFVDVAPLDQAGAEQISFFDNIKYIDQFVKTEAGACFVHPDMADKAPANTALLVHKSPYKAYALAAQRFYPEVQKPAEISSASHVAVSAEIADGCRIEAGAVIGENVKIGAGTRIEHNAVIDDNVVIGSHCRVGSNASVSHSIIGDHVRLYPGVRIGQDGFGFAIDPQGHVKVPQLGRVMIEDHVEIGANTCIDRGAGPDTVIGQGTWIDNLVQIGHNVKIGKGCVIVSQVGISGSTVLEDFVALGGQVGVAGHLRIGMGAQVAAQSGIMKDIPPGEVQMGYPAMPQKEFFRQVATLNRLIKTKKNHK